MALLTDEAVREAWGAGFTPEPRLTVSEWADRYRELPMKSSAEPGRWRTARTPYLREIMDCLSASSAIEEIVFMKGSQVGGTEAILNALGYAIDQSPGPMMVVQPTVELAKRFSRQRVDPLVSTPPLAGKVAEIRSRDRANTMLAKEFDGGLLVITGANSAVGLRSMPARWLLLDEIDGYPADVDGEGAPIELAEARQRTFARRKRIKVSTPTLEGYSPVEAAYLRTDRRRYYVPCPFCGERQPLEFESLKWRSLDRPPEAAAYECRTCRGLIPEHHKRDMLAAGAWVPEGTSADPRLRGYHLSALYSPIGWLSWAEIARQHDRAQTPETQRVFRNTVLGRPWRVRGEAPQWEALMRRRDPYPIGTAPAGVLFLTAGVDVQKDRLVYEIVGWGREKRSWSIDYGLLPGDTADLEGGPWPQLDALLARPVAHAAGSRLQIRLLAIDSGYNTQHVYTWASRYSMSQVIAIKGQDHGELIGAPAPVQVTGRGRRIKAGFKAWPVCGARAKSELYGWLRLEPPAEGPTPPGFCAFPEYGESYFKELTAEQLIARTSRRGYVVLEWTLLAGRANHALDCRVYARAAAELVGLSRFGEAAWLEFERALGVEPPPPSSRGPAPSPTPASAPRRGSGWLTPRPDWLR